MENLKSMIKILQNMGDPDLKLIGVLTLTPAGPEIQNLLSTLNCRGAKNLTVCLNFECSALSILAHLFISLRNDL